MILDGARRRKIYFKGVSKIFMFSKFFVFTFAVFTFGLFSIAAHAAPPANDNFANAQLFSGVSGQVVGTTAEGTHEAGEPIHAHTRGVASVWYKYVAPGNGVLNMNTYDNGFDATLAVYQGSSLGNLTLIAANNNTETTGFISAATVYVGMKAGATYYIAVDGDTNNGSGLGVVKLNFTFDNAAPNDNFANAQDLHAFPDVYLSSYTNVGASKEPGEPNHAGNVGGKSVWFRWKNYSDVSRSEFFTLETRSVDSYIIGTPVTFAVYTGASVGALTEVKSTSVCYSCDGKLQFLAEPNTIYYIAVDGWDSNNGNGAALGNFILKHGGARSGKAPDFDRDGKADIAVYRPTTGIWYSLDSESDRLRSYSWGANADKPLINNMDNDVKQERIVFRPDVGNWYYNSTIADSFNGFGWGASSDIPLTYNAPAGRVAVFRPTDGSWWIYNYANSYGFQFGQLGDIPVTADFTGDGKDEFAVFRPSNGTWYIAGQTGVPSQNFDAVQFGQAGDKPVVADYDADGKADIAVYRPSNGTWYMLRSSDGAFRGMQFGNSTDKPQPADYDGDGKADIAVYRPSTGVWYIWRSWTNSLKAVQFGQNADIPISAPVQ